MRRIALLLALTPLAFAPAPVAAQGRAAQAVDGRAVALEVKRLLNQHYVLPETRAKFAAALDKGIAAGRYSVTDPTLLVTRLNEDLASVTPDKHLGVIFDPHRSKALASAPVGGGADDAPPSPGDIRQSELNNHGLTRMEVLPGNVRYLEISGFDCRHDPCVTGFSP